MPPTVTVVRTPACHLCTEAEQILTDLARQSPPQVELVVYDAAGPAGAALVAEQRPPLFPLVLLDGVYFSAGRLPRRKLAARLATLAEAAR